MPRRVYFVDSIPVNENGKPVRKQAVNQVKGLEPTVIANYQPPKMKE